MPIYHMYNLRTGTVNLFSADREGRSLAENRRSIAMLKSPGRSAEEIFTKLERHGIARYSRNKRARSFGEARWYRAG